MQQDVLALPVRVDILDHGAAYGAALLAGVGVGLLGDLDALLASTVIVIGELSMPDVSAAAEYKRIHRRYMALDPALREV
jgi:xylulokinase